MRKRNVDKQHENDESEDLLQAVVAKATVSMKHFLLLFWMAILAWFHLVLEMQLVSLPPCLKHPCGFLQIRVKRGRGVNCEEKCVFLWKLHAISEGWSCGTCLQCFNTKLELKEAVNHTMCDPVSAKAKYADSYGWPMGKWCFTANVKDMSSLFAKTVANYNFHDVDLSDWDPSHVTDMSRMFSDRFFMDFRIDVWNVSNVRNMREMLARVWVFDTNLSSWDTSRVTDMTGMFASPFTAKRGFNNDISSWNVSNVRDMRHMFYHAKEFNSDLSSWDTSSVTNMSSMFYMATHFQGEGIGNWNVTNVRNMYAMFGGAMQFHTNLSNWDTSSVSDMSCMFDEAHGFQGDVSTWNVSNVRDFSSMFRHAENFTSDLSAWDTSSATDISNMFRGATNFQSDISAWDV
jgi:surface protein